MKLLALGLIIGVALPLSAWGQVSVEVKLPQPGVEYLGSKQVDEQCFVSFVKPGPFPCTYPVRTYPPRTYPASTYPPSPSVPAMCEAKKVYQADVDQAIQHVPPGDDVKKKAIEQRYQQRQL